MSTKSPDPSQRISLLSLIKDAYEDLISTTDRASRTNADLHGHGALGELISIAELVETGQLEIARQKVLNVVEQYPGDFHVQYCSSRILQVLGLELEAIKALMTALAIQPSNGAIYKRVAVYLRDSGAPNRCRVILTTGWDHQKGIVRRRDLETAKKEYFALPANSTSDT